jgi:hypothetical protein
LKLGKADVGGAQEGLTLCGVYGDAGVITVGVVSIEVAIDEDVLRFGSVRAVPVIAAPQSELR